MKIFKIIIPVLIGMTLSNCVQETHLKTVTFKVDMRHVENPVQVGLRGNLTDPSWKETVLMSDEDQDGIYEVTLEQKTAINGIEFKFVNQDNDFELQGQDNRTLLFEYKPETIVYEAVFNNPNGIQTSIK